MKKLSLFLICFLQFVIFYGQEDINQMDEEGKRHGLWRKYYNNNRVRYSGTFEHGKEVGVFKYYSASNSDFPIIVKEFESKSDLAKVSFYTPKGVLESEGMMRGKLREGKWLFYHPDGKSIMSEENYVNGKLEGDYKTFYLSGEPTEIAAYKNGLLHGNYKKYSIKGFLYQDFNYANGKLNGMAVFYSRKSGDLIKKGPFKDDLRVGTWENYVDGELVSTEQPALKPEKKED
ncbi:toxin-antitoxin system YwqK family antitoxin [Lutimonas zeaxanthinifaciens]|uniref:toxin-antitoxin system YwqK family antitoxin n=1 Tax=Lutimonas zeaxanthinifaciens TaxID=3060215 RepID=UPI00265CAEC2|nr:toxin-antitoxin system YwqK family antitoxin [Lutimonas sp. YSD2104]WKK64806.1 toxin-antitoxin system YwqK family antitoxin [Lutimonas sp. YSD2104]